MTILAQFTCEEYENKIVMDTFEYKCPHCNMVSVVTPCHAFDIKNIMSAVTMVKIYDRI